MMTAAAGFWERCPKCDTIGKIDIDQAEGRVSIICSNKDCRHHYHKERVK